MTKKLGIFMLSLPLIYAGSAMAADSVNINTTPNQGQDFGGFHQQMEQRFQNIMGSFFNEPAAQGQGLVMVDSGYPKADVINNADDVEVKVDLPGIKKESVEVLVFEENINLKVTQEVEKKTEDDKGYYMSERQTGSFQRVIALPAYVDYENATQEFKDGVLTIKIPKAKEQKAKFKKLEIK